MNSKPLKKQVLRILLVEDHSLARAGMVAILGAASDFGVVREAATTLEAVDLLKTLRPDIALVDVRIGRDNRIELVRAICQEAPWTLAVMLTSHAPEAELLGGLVRRHWGIENRCHWVLDMTFDEDQCRVRKGHAAENLALLRKLNLNLLRPDQTIKDTMRGKRISAALGDKTLSTLMKLDITK